MNSMAGDVYFDANTLNNFAVIGRLELLAGRYSHRARWTEGVQQEIQRGACVVPALRDILTAHWLPPATDAAPKMSDMRDIDNLRRALGGTANQPLLHLGEAETIHCIQRYGPGSLFATDDRAAADLARRRRIHVIDTPRILSECHSLGEVKCPEAWDLLNDMARHGRLVRIPPTHHEICP